MSEPWEIIHEKIADLPIGRIRKLPKRRLIGSPRTGYMKSCHMPLAQLLTLLKTPMLRINGASKAQELHCCNKSGTGQLPIQPKLYSGLMALQERARYDEDEYTCQVLN